MKNIFSVEGKVAVITGAGGVLGGSITKSLSEAGTKIVMLDIRKENLDCKVAELQSFDKEAIGFVCDVLSAESLRKTAAKIVKKWGKIDILINCAGGNIPGATLSSSQTIFDMKVEDWERVVALNQNGTVYPCLIFGKVMSEQKEGSIINISSMATYNAITRVPGYSVAKTGINIFTQWLATELARKFGEGIRVNAIAPGFFIGDQNRAVLINSDGTLTERSKKILAKTPMGRFGDISELNGAVQFLCSPAARFITGTILPIDGGFSAFSGV
ncbi:SDR family oxidoreductase [Candidatus Azobacteroides pseudotrichonymphae]|uniref:Fructuronate reductase n=1 Tax=Azobacteroides pseudotrichonymphae genomovar. CFP2 TaxID=511995 RepID=B6YQJ1_AZOPC|nr:SDR family oxidoreductase [Candidatus Azobacteroides pseudotrichonymphae]BAG83463.1 putative fructuronate reductase [Candidatus Azobacteroides pseudotrichonymphae genomovar. CFP2]